MFCCAMAPKTNKSFFASNWWTKGGSLEVEKSKKTIHGVLFFSMYTVVKVDGEPLPKGGHDNPIHGSCAVFFPLYIYIHTYTFRIHNFMYRIYTGF